MASERQNDLGDEFSSEDFRRTQEDAASLASGVGTSS